MPVGGGTIPAVIIGRLDSSRATSAHRRQDWRTAISRCEAWVQRSSVVAAAASPGRAGSAASTSRTHRPATCSASVSAAATTDAPAPAEPDRTGMSVPNRAQVAGRRVASGNASSAIAATTSLARLATAAG